MPAGESDTGTRGAEKRRIVAVFSAFLKLGLTSFGGPVAHIGYFRDEFVTRRKWLSDRDYTDLVALCQFLPGPASSQVAIGIGLSRTGLAGGAAAWCGFTAPSALLLIAFGFGAVALGDALSRDWLHGLKVVAVAVVAQAVWGMARTSSRGAGRASITIAAAVAALLAPGPLVQVTAILTAGVIGWLAFDAPAAGNVDMSSFRGNTRRSIAALSIFFVLLAALPLAAATFPNRALEVFDSFYRVGSLVFGGGHVVLPLLQAEVVTPAWVSEDRFLAGYGAAQAVPGPLFTFAAYLGAVMQEPPNGWAGALLCLTAIFLPSILLVYGTLPIWDLLRQRSAIQAASFGINAGVVGLLLAVLYDPVWTSAIRSVGDFALAVAALLMLTVLKLPPWLVVIVTAAGGAVVHAVA